MATRAGSRGVIALVVATVFTAATVDAADGLLQVVTRFLGALLVGWAVAVLAARSWESATWPQAESFATRTAQSSGQAMLRADANASLFGDRGGFLFTRRVFFTATGLPPVQLSADAYAVMASQQGTRPQQLARTSARTWWWFEDEFYWENYGYSGDDVLALLRDRQRRHARKLDRAHLALQLEQEPASRREPIPVELRKAVFARDGGRCTACGENFDIQYDHIIPVSLGGATSLENLQILCAPCNRAKSDLL